uniref:Light-independent protochlorophyllide reductase subunit B n=1 Tax=Neogoniolithon spectabile TaxID=231755 RepID=A0A3G3MGT9_9FLOR|nr:photochlorophyllide reductase [Neogoniolithon spectabile]AYR06049.1 photochlorophyllide reductase [Neogoniolithon spectabile]
MKLAYWMYVGPAHIGTLRVASSFRNVHAVMHAPLGDDYFMKSMLEREREFTPVSASIVDRHVLARGSQQKVMDHIERQDKQEKPNLIVLTPTCTSSILQEDLKNFVDRAALQTSADVLLADVNHYRLNELQAADKTLYQIIEFYVSKIIRSSRFKEKKTARPSANIIGSMSLGFHNQHDLAELKRLLYDLNIDLNLVIPVGLSVQQIHSISNAWFNFVPYREVGRLTAEYLKDCFSMPFIDIVPIGTSQLNRCIKEIEKVLNSQGANVDYCQYIDEQTRFITQAPWFSRSIDCQNLTGKRAVVFGDSTHSAAITKILANEMSIKVVWSGTYCLYDHDWFRNQVENFCDQVVMSDDYTLIANLIEETQPDAIFGTQMERHIGKRLSIPCGVISSPVHIQNFPLSYRPFVGYEGTNQISDLIYNSFTLGMEDHLLDLFGGHDTKNFSNNSLPLAANCIWSPEALSELKRVPGFVRNKVKKNTEKFAAKNRIDYILVDTIYSAKESFRS